MDVTTKLKRRTKEPRKMFMLFFRQNEDINKIFAITDIMGVRVEVVPVNKNKLVAKCENCQSFE